MTASLMSAALETKQTSVSLIVSSRVLERDAGERFGSESEFAVGALEVSHESLGSLWQESSIPSPLKCPASCLA